MAFADYPANVQNRNSVRSSASITWAVWKALLLREAVARLSATRTAWLWLILDPVVQVIFLIVLFGFVLQKLIGNIDMGLFITTGVLGFGLARNTAMRIKDAITANDTLLTYRQVLAVDTVLVRAGLEALLFIISAVPSADALKLDFPSRTGRSYTLWRSATLAAGSWTNTGLAALPGTGTVRR